MVGGGGRWRKARKEDTLGMRRVSFARCPADCLTPLKVEEGILSSCHYTITHLILLATDLDMNGNKRLRGRDESRLPTTMVYPVEMPRGKPEKKPRIVKKYDKGDIIDVDFDYNALITAVQDVDPAQL